MPLTLPAPGRTQPTPRANRSLAAELTGALTSTLGIELSSPKGWRPADEPLPNGNTAAVKRQ